MSAWSPSYSLYKFITLNIICKITKKKPYKSFERIIEVLELYSFPHRISAVVRSHNS